MLNLKQQTDIQTLYITRTKKTPSGVTSWDFIAISRSTGVRTSGLLNLISEDNRVLEFQIYINQSETYNIDLDGGGFYDFQLIANINSEEELMTSGLMYYDLNGGEGDVIYNTFGDTSTFKGYE